MLKDMRETSKLNKHQFGPDSSSVVQHLQGVRDSSQLWRRSIIPKVEIQALLQKQQSSNKPKKGVGLCVGALVQSFLVEHFPLDPAAPGRLAWQLNFQVKAALNFCSSLPVLHFCVEDILLLSE